MKLIVISCLLLAGLGATIATERVEDVISENSQTNTQKSKRFIFDKTAQIQKLLRSLTSFSSIISNNNNNYRPSTSPAPTTTSTTAVPDQTYVTSDIPDSTPAITETSTIAPQKSQNDQDLDLLTQYRDNAYALPENSQKSDSRQTVSTVEHWPQFSQHQQPISLATPQIYPTVQWLAPVVPQYSAQLPVSYWPAAQQTYSGLSHISHLSYVPNHQLIQPRAPLVTASFISQPAAQVTQTSYGRPTQCSCSDVNAKY